MPDERDLRTQLFLAGRAAASDALALAQAASGASPDDPGWRAAAEFLAKAPEPHLPLTGEDVMASGRVRGKARRRRAQVLAGALDRAGFPEDPVAVARLLDEVLAEVAPASEARDSSLRPGRAIFVRLVSLRCV